MNITKIDVISQKPSKNQFYHRNINTLVKLEKFASCNKTKIVNLIKKPRHPKSNVNIAEKETLNTLQLNDNIKIQKGQ